MNKEFDKTTKKHYYWLDLLRFIAAFLVLCQHTRTLYFPTIYELPSNGGVERVIQFVFYLATRFGHYWVLLFFVLSGFLVGGKVLESLKTGSFNARNYFIDRFVRITLPLVAALVLVVICNALMGVDNDPWLITGNLFSLQGIFVRNASGPLWSLSYEVWLYCIMGIGGIFVLAKSNKSKTIVFILLIIVVMSFLKLNYIYGIIWFIGAMAYGNIAKKPSLLLVGIYTFMALLFLGLALFTEKENQWAAPVVELLFSLFLSLVLQQIVVYKPTGKISILLNACGVKLAVFSYTLYLTHYPLIHLINYWGVNKFETLSLYSFGIYAAIVLFCVAMAYLIYLLSEKHTSIIKKIIKDFVRC